jgi:Peptidase C13 family
MRSVVLYEGHESLDPKELREELDRAGIKWRVVMISGCSSGAFVPPLKDDFTLIATAAAADRNSFGCASGREFTEFGRAVLGEQLTESRSFVGAFEHARAMIRDREAAQGLEPSIPQLFVGEAIASKLQAFEADLSHGSSASAPSTVP